MIDNHQVSNIKSRHHASTSYNIKWINIITEGKSKPKRNNYNNTYHNYKKLNFLFHLYPVKGTSIYNYFFFFFYSPKALFELFHLLIMLAHEQAATKFFEAATPLEFSV